MNFIQIDNEGIALEAFQVTSPNFDARPEPNDISMVVIHNISLPPQTYGGSGVIELFTNNINPQDHPYFEKIQGLKVSSHFFIRRDGSLIQFVSCCKRAWHAGQSQWKNKSRCNDFSIGIELEGSDFDAFTDKQYECLNRLIHGIKRVYPIKDVVGHSDISPGRKTDPGPFFDWQRVLVD